MPRDERRSADRPTRRREQVNLSDSGTGGYGGPLRRRGDAPEADGSGSRRHATVAESAGRRGPGTLRRTDESLTEAIQEQLGEHPEIDATGIEVLVEGGEVTLQGTVEDRDIRWLVEDLVEGVAGVSLVHNRLRVAKH